MESALSLRLLLVLTLPFGFAGCASTSHVSAFQEAVIPSAPRTLALALDRDEKLPFGIAPTAIAAAATRAGFVLDETAPRYRLSLTAASGSSRAGSFLPAADAKGAPNWVARPDRDWRARFVGGRVLR